MIEGHGDDTYKYKLIKMNFSSNIYAHADHSALNEHLKRNLHLIESYPEPQPYKLKNLLAEKHSIDPSCVLVTNGATEAIYLIAQAFRNGIRKTKTPSFFVKHPTFSEYEDAMRNFCYVESKSAEPHAGTEMLTWICNPNNPTGEVTPQDQINALLAHKDTLLIIDQSYEHYTQSKLLTDEAAVQNGNVILLHSMTKNYAIPGLRIGYITAAPELIRRISQCQPPWSVNALAIEAAIFLARLSADRAGSSLVPRLDNYLEETERLRTTLDKIDGITANPTQTNFFLCTIQNSTARQLKAYLAEKHHILIRDASNFKGLSEKHFRVAAQTPKENQALVQAIQEYIKNLNT